MSDDPSQRWQELFEQGQEATRAVDDFKERVLAYLDGYEQIVRAVVEADTTFENRGKIVCLYCDGKPDYSAGINDFSHATDCIVVRARRLLGQTREAML